MDISYTLICPRDDATDNDSDSENDKVIVIEHVSNTIDDSKPAQPTRNGVDENTDWDGEINFDTDKAPSAIITALQDRLGTGDVLDNNSDKKTYGNLKHDCRNNSTSKLQMEGHTIRTSGAQQQTLWRTQC